MREAGGLEAPHELDGLGNPLAAERLAARAGDLDPILLRPPPVGGDRVQVRIRRELASVRT